MGTRASNKQPSGQIRYTATTVTDIPAFPRLTEASAHIASPFLKSRVDQYIDAATMLVEELSLPPQIAAQQPLHMDALRFSLKAFGKQARLLDLVLAVGGTSGYMEGSDKLTAFKIRLSVEKKVATLATLNSDGTLALNAGNDRLAEATHSRLGRKMGALFARFATGASLQGTDELSIRQQALPETLRKEISDQLAQAQKHILNKELNEAVHLCSTILKQDSRNPDALSMMGQSLWMGGNSLGAIPFFKEAAAILPDNRTIRQQLGTAYLDAREGENALKTFETLHQEDPQEIKFILGRAFAHMTLGNDTEARTALQSALKLAPESADVLLAMGMHYSQQYDLDKAGNYFARALKAAPKNAQTLTRYAALLLWQGKKTEALSLLDQALKTAPEDIYAKMTKAMALLNLGQYKEGWALYEAGLKDTINFRATTVKISGPSKVWDGSDAPQSNLLIYVEQGLGDGIQFIRYAPLCKPKVKNVIVVCPPQLKRLFETCKGIDKVSTAVVGRQFDTHIAMLSLPHAFGTTLETVPAAVPYFTIPKSDREKAGRKITAPTGNIKVGLVWSGSMFKNTVRGDLVAQRRNVALQQLTPLFAIEKTSFFSLQLGDTADEIAQAGLKDRLTNVMGDVKDMLDTAALIENLDLVISVDTSVAHLAGALGKPVWILSRFDACWRWLENRPTNPWYPSARIFGQPKAGLWEPVIAEIAAALQEKVRSLS